MRLSAWHRDQGHEVVFTRQASIDMFEGKLDRVYGSAIFQFSQPKIETFKAWYPDAIIGGTGVDVTTTLDDYVESAFDGLDYSIYPDFKASIGFTQRGCRLKCKFCVVPQKEGRIQSTATIQDIWRGDGYAKQIHLLDNDFFGNPEWPDRVNEANEGGFKICFSQGINIRFVTDEVAAAIASIQYRDNKFQRRRLYTAWDNLGDERRFFDGVDRLEAAGVPPNHLMAYMLIGYDKREDWDRIFHRFNRMVERGILPYPMVYDPQRKDLKRFQRWVVTGLYRAVPWNEYDAGRKAA